MAQPLSVAVKIIGTVQKTSLKNPAAPKAFWITSAYVDMPGMIYPQAVELFVGDVTQVLTPGDYIVSCSFPIKDNRPAVELDLSAARPAHSKAA